MRVADRGLVRVRIGVARRDTARSPRCRDSRTGSSPRRRSRSRYVRRLVDLGLIAALDDHLFERRQPAREHVVALPAGAGVAEHDRRGLRREPFARRPAAWSGWLQSKSRDTPDRRSETTRSARPSESRSAIFTLGQRLEEARRTARLRSRADARASSTRAPAPRVSSSCDRFATRAARRHRAHRVHRIVPAGVVVERSRQRRADLAVLPARLLVRRGSRANRGSGAPRRPLPAVRGAVESRAGIDQDARHARAR